MAKKQCNKCKIEKDLSEFHKNKNMKYGVRGDCKSCRNVKVTKKQKSKELYDIGYKVCKCCKMELSLKEFTKSKVVDFGLSPRCASCMNKTLTRKSKDYGDRKECSMCREVKLKSEFYKRKNSKSGIRSECKKCSKTYTNRNTYDVCVVCETIYHKKNGALKTCSKECSNKLSKSTSKESARKWAENNPGKRRLNVSSRRKALKRATPGWVDMDEVNSIYLKSEEMNLDSIKYHVDHIIPLISDLVSGLNVPWNLQIIEKKLNLIKANKFDGTNDNNSWREDV